MVKPVPCEHPGQDLPCQGATAADRGGGGVAAGDGVHVAIGLNLGGAGEGTLFRALAGHPVAGADLHRRHCGNWGHLLGAPGTHLVTQLHLDVRDEVQHSVDWLQVAVLASVRLSVTSLWINSYFFVLVQKCYMTGVILKVIPGT